MVEYKQKLPDNPKTFVSITLDDNALSDTLNVALPVHWAHLHDGVQVIVVVLATVDINLLVQEFLFENVLVFDELVTVARLVFKEWEFRITLLCTFNLCLSRCCIIQFILMTGGKLV